MRLFIGLRIPDEAALRVRLSSRRFREYIQERLPRHRWHITLFFLGEIEDVEQYREVLLAPIGSSFVPTVRLTHLGKGLVPRQLWAYVEPNPQLLQIHRTIKRRLMAHSISMTGGEQGKHFVPHIHVADLKEETPMLQLPDWPLLTTFLAGEAYLFKSEGRDDERKYTPVGTLPLVTHEKIVKH